MDNKNISVTHFSKEAFDLTFQLFFISEYDSSFKTKATHYINHLDKGLILLWHEDKFHESIPLLTPLGWKESADLAWTWLQNLPKERFPQYSDIDGSVKEGYTIYNEAWGRVVSHYSILAVKPAWALYGK
jgi:hypothetical protein